MSHGDGAPAVLLQALGVILLWGCFLFIILERMIRPVDRLRTWIGRSAPEDEEQQPVHLDADDLAF
jgi:hypothetical protein